MKSVSSFLFIGALLCGLNVQASEQLIRMKTGNGYVDVPVSAIDSADVQLRTLETGKVVGPCSLTGTNLSSFLSPIPFSNPVELGYPGGINTGRIVLHLNPSSGLQPLVRVFDLQNYELLEDELYPTVVYDKVAPQLDEAWFNSHGCR